MWFTENFSGIYIPKFNVKSLGFTLAEVLITLGIIGVVAAITLPTLSAKLTNIRNSAILKEDYSILNQVMKRAYDDGASVENFATNNLDSMKAWFNSYLLPYMTVANICYDTSGCWTNQKIKDLSGNISSVAAGGDGKMGFKPICFVLNNGSNVCIDDHDANAMYQVYGVKINSSMGIELYVDVNGDKQPNVYGKDVFVFVAAEDYFAPAGSSLTSQEILKDCSKGNRGLYCAALAKSNGWNIKEIK